jgi:hypothetical protein
MDLQDFISPTRLAVKIDSPLLKARIPDWRAMVDVVLIHTAYDGQVLDITLSGVPEKKDDGSPATTSSPPPRPPPASPSKSSTCWAKR